MLKPKPILIKNDLGWLNAKGTEADRIRAAHVECNNKGHIQKSENEGINATVHAVWCDECGYIYRIDSGG